ncbi:MAG TPA: D-alanyl-D-alanine carboxypeptidase/D-alanyl-D-alanine-endopeptidase [Polyangiaceae bacterium]|nr:D-alanyl-D-alanine carboxypeptidase/D-alanyl-D-alanine-endopeptidase [Polyangiaceae bacterium]
MRFWRRWNEPARRCWLVAALVAIPPLVLTLSPVYTRAENAAAPLLSTGSSGSQPAGSRPPPLDQHAKERAAFGDLERWVKEQGGTLGAVVLDLNSSKYWISLAPKQPLNPASNQKLLTAAVALDTLGAGYRYRTSLYGRLEQATVRELTLTGHGDPSLGSEDLWRLGRALTAQGVKRIDGDLVVDQGRFDEAFEPPAYAQQPGEWASFRAPVSAISVDQNTVTLNVLATEPGSPARLWFEPPGFVEIQGSVATRARGQGQELDWRLTPAAQGVRALLSGHVSAGQPRVRLVRRVADPRPIPGRVLGALLAEMGVEWSGKVRLGATSGGERLAYVTSPPLAQLLGELGKNSDNFYAEMIFKTLGEGTKGEPATSEAAAQRVLAWLAKAGLVDPHTKVVNGSGLFDANRISAELLAQLLGKVYLDPELGPDFVAHLAIGGVDGTLRSRFRGAATRGRVRAKTGTLRNADTLSGYVLSSSGRLPLVFAVLVNGIDERHTAVRERIDRAVSVLAEH